MNGKILSGLHHPKTGTWYINYFKYCIERILTCVFILNIKSNGFRPSDDPLQWNMHIPVIMYNIKLCV